MTDVICLLERCIYNAATHCVKSEIILDEEHSCCGGCDDGWFFYDDDEEEDEDHVPRPLHP